MATSRDPTASKPGAEGEEEPAILDLVALPWPGGRIDGVVVGRLAAAGDDLTVAFDGAPAEGVPARSMIDLGPGDEGAEIAIVFERGDPTRPLILGKMASRAKRARVVEGASVEVRREEGRLVLEEENEIVLRCGEASITLTRAGKVLIKGAYVLTHAEGINRIRGGAVEIN